MTAPVLQTTITRADGGASAPATHDPDEPFFQNLIEQLGAGILVYEYSGRILYSNRRARQVLKSGSVLGKDIGAVLGHTPHLFVAERQAKGGCGEVPIGGPDTGCCIGYRVQEIVQGGAAHKDRAFLVLFQEITEKNKLRLEQDDALRMTSVGRLLPTLAHEIKNPLAGIRSIVEVMLETSVQSQQTEDLESILDAVNRLGVLVDRLGLLEESLVDGRSTTNLANIAHDAMTMVRRRAELRGVALSYSGEKHVPCRLQPDLTYFVLLNLLINSIEATDQGGSIQVLAVRGPEGILFGVRDTGCGMSPELVAKACDPFFTTKLHGCGIGLSLTRQIVDRSGGVFEIQSTQGLGTVVTIVLDDNTD